MNNKTEFKENRKLDNRREPVDVTLIKLSYKMGDEEVKREKIKYKSKSGYCLDPVKTNELSINFDEIGKLVVAHSSNTNAKNPQWRIYSYIHKEKEAIEKLKIALNSQRQSLIQKAASIPFI